MLLQKQKSIFLASFMLYGSAETPTQRKGLADSPVFEIPIDHTGQVQEQR